MNSVERRVGRLEDKLGTTKRSPVIQITIFRVGCEPSLDESTCMRRLGPNGVITELIYWSGRRDQMGDEILDQFVEAFPIETHAPCAVPDCR